MMALQEILEQYEGRLTKADQKLIGVLLENPAEGILRSSIEISKKAGVHPATVTRLARKLGFKSYADFRIKLYENSPLLSKGSERIKNRLDKMGSDFILQSMVKSEIQALESIMDHINQEKMEKTAEMLIESKRTAVFGIGHASSIADLMARRLNRSGYPAYSFNSTGWDFAEELLKLDCCDVLIAFVFRSVSQALSSLLDRIHRTGGKSIVISDFVGPIIRPQPDLLLMASRGKEGEAQSLTVPTVICNSLILEISNRDNGYSLSSLEKLAKVREELKG